MNCYYLVSHGSYTSINKKNFDVPKNIRLIQYTTPGSYLSHFAATYIFNNSCNNNTVSENLYGVTEDGNLFKEKIKVKTINPGGKTVDLDLVFGDKVGNISLGVYEKNGNKLYLKIDEKKEVMVSLSKYLEKISDLIEYNNISGIVDVHQISCRGESELLQIDKIIKKTVKNKPITEADIDETIRKFDNMKIESTPPNKDFYNKKVVLYTDNKDEAKSRALNISKSKTLGIWRKVNIIQSKIEKKNKTYKKRTEARQSKVFESITKRKTRKTKK